MSCLTDKVAIVTGSSRGLGRACARELADHGAKVVLNYYTNQESADELLAEMKGKGQEAIVVQAGVAHPDDCNRLIEETVKRFGGLDILVNNAGVNRDRTIRRMSVEEWREVMATDLDSIFYCTYAAVPHMIERGGGRIVNMSSIVGQMGNLGQSNYAAAKAGIVGFSKSAAGDQPYGGRSEGAARQDPAGPFWPAWGSGADLSLPRDRGRVHYGRSDQHQRRNVHAIIERHEQGVWNQGGRRRARWDGGRTTSLSYGRGV